MSVTEELRHLLDERGVEWETDRSGFRVMWGKPVDEFHDTMQFKAVDNALPNGGLNVHICGFTPEQAIAATLGRRECECDGTIRWEWEWTDQTTCYEHELSCGHVITSMEEEPPNYCEECGARIRKAAGE